MKKLILIIPAILITVFSALGQEAKKGCNPAACSPGNTKVEEAAVITDLRADLSKLKNRLYEQGQLSTNEVAIGKNEKESLQIIRREIKQVEKLQGRTPSDFTKLKDAQLVSALKNAIKSLN